MTNYQQTSTDLANKKDHIDGLPIKKTWIEELAQKAFKTTARLVDITGKRIDENQGYLSMILRLSLTWSENSNDLPKEVVLKLPCFSKMEGIIDEMAKEGELGDHKINETEMAAFAELVKTFHGNECAFYNLFGDSKTTPDGAKQNGCYEHRPEPPVPIPRCYLNKAFDEKPGYLLMEDFTGRGKTPDLARGLSMEQCLVLIDCMASVHAYSIKHPESIADDKFKLMDNKSFEKFGDYIKLQAAGFRKSFPGTFSASDEDIEIALDMTKLMEKQDYRKKQYFPVLVHGDLWTNNLLFGVVSGDNKATTDELLAIIDWQAAHPGPCAEDLGRLLVTSVDFQQRRDNEEMLLEEYYRRLREKLPSEVEPPYSLEEVKSLYFNLSLPYATTLMALHAGMFVKAVAKDPENVTTKGPERLIARLQGAIEDCVSIISKQQKQSH